MAWPASALAEQKVSLHGLDVHYAAFNSSFLDPAIASKHGLTRAADVGVLNIAVRKPADGEGNSQAVSADLKGVVRNLLSQKRSLAFHEIRSGEAIYYVANFKFTTDERLFFEVNVQAGQNTILVHFEQQFYVD